MEKFLGEGKYGALSGAPVFLSPGAHRLDTRKDGDRMKKSRVRVFLLHRRLLAVPMYAGGGGGYLLCDVVSRVTGRGGFHTALPIYSVERKEKLCSISFDAAWGDGKMRQFSC